MQKYEKTGSTISVCKFNVKDKQEQFHSKL